MSLAMPDTIRGDVWLADLGIAAKVRPCLVLSIPVLDVDRALVTLVPHSTSPRESRFEVKCSARFLRSGVFDAQNLITVPQVKLLRRLGKLELSELQAVEMAIRFLARTLAADMLKHNLHEWDRTLVWHAFTQMAEYEPLILERGEGCMLVDIDGHQYIDGTSSLWCNIHGHRHPRIDAAIRAQLDRVAHVTNLGSSNPTTIMLASGWLI